MTEFFVSLCGLIVAALLAPWVGRRLGRWSGWLLAFFPLMVLVQLLRLWPGLLQGETPVLSLPWAAELGLSLTLRLDGLGALLALLVAGIGALILIYGAAYLEGDARLGRFLSVTLLFMLAMLGVSVSDNALLLFVFWELTSITSFLLIGFDHERAEARAAAWQALLVTGGGGLALLAGFILLGNLTGSFDISVWVMQRQMLTAQPQTTVALLLIVLGAMTKSAQFPFHFWLPNAMQAPTPVSAYLHSATMVKAGVFLLARLLPVLGGLALWPVLLPWVGWVTLLVGALLALGQTDLKRLLAYSTVASLGALVLLLGLNTPLSVKAAMVFLPAHALYKGALFLVAGGVDHAVHRRDVRQLGGLRRALPWTALAGGVAAFSMAGLPPLLGFLSKELLYESLLSAPSAVLMTVGGVLANVLLTAVAAWVGLRPFWGQLKSGLDHAHEGAVGLWLAPLLLALVGLLAGAWPGEVGRWLIAPAVQAVWLEPVKVKLSLWHGFNLPLLLSLLTLVLAGGVYALQLAQRLAEARWWAALGRFGPATWYERTLKAVLGFAAWQTRLLQNGYLRRYILWIVFLSVALALPLALLSLGGLPPVVWSGARFYDVILVGIIIVAAFLVTRSRSRLATIALLGSIGYSIAILFLLYSAPDLAMTQFAVETLTVILFVLVIYRLPKFRQLSSRRRRLWDVTVAVLGGVMMTTLMLVVSWQGQDSQLASYFMHNSLSQAFGRNVVNVILVDFRGFDTLGEITVLAIAAIGVFALLKGGAVRRAQGGEDE